MYCIAKVSIKSKYRDTILSPSTDFPNSLENALDIRSIELVTYTGPDKQLLSWKNACEKRDFENTKINMKYV